MTKVLHNHQSVGLTRYQLRSTPPRGVEAHCGNGDSALYWELFTVSFIVVFKQFPQLPLFPSKSTLCPNNGKTNYRK
jgi:hypothetical protein